MNGDGFELAMLAALIWVAHWADWVALLASIGAVVWLEVKNRRRTRDRDRRDLRRSAERSGR